MIVSLITYVPLISFFELRYYIDTIIVTLSLMCLDTTKDMLAYSRVEKYRLRSTRMVAGNRT